MEVYTGLDRIVCTSAVWCQVLGSQALVDVDATSLLMTHVLVSRVSTTSIREVARLALRSWGKPAKVLFGSIR